MNQKQLKREIKNKSLRNFYIFCSDDYFLKKLYLDRIKKAVNCDIERMEIENEDEIDKIKQHTHTMKLFSTHSHRLIYARIYFNLDHIDLSGIENKSGNIVILDPIGCKNVKHKDMVVFDKPTEKEIKSFISYKMKQNRRTIDNQISEKIAQEFANRDTSSLNLFLDKVLLYAEGNRAIEYNNVINLMDDMPSIGVYTLIGHIMRKDTDYFFKNIDALLDEIHPSAFISILSKEIIKTLAANYIKDENILKTMEINSNYYLKYKNYCMNIGIEKIKEILYILYDMDVIIKSLSLNGFKEIFKAKMFKWFL